MSVFSLKTTRTCSIRGNLCVTAEFVGYLWLFDKPQTLFQKQQWHFHPASFLQQPSTFLQQRLLFGASPFTSWTEERTGRVYRHILKKKKSSTQYARIKWWHIKWKRSWSINPPISEWLQCMDCTVEEKQLERLNIWPKY